MELSNTRDQSTAPSNSLSQALQRHQLVCYFLLAFGFTWVYELPALMLWHANLYGPWMAPAFYGPSLSALLMTAALEGKPGVHRLLRRYALWRVGLPWYLFVLLGIPTLILLGALTVPGTVATFRAPAPLFLLTFVLIYLFLLAEVAGEETGWRGFALPRLQQRYGPLGGTLILGSLWGLWHLPFVLFFPGYNGVGTGFLGIGLPFVEFVIFIIALTLIITWVFNHVRGSLLLVLLLHTTYNAGSYLFSSMVRLVNVNVYLSFVVVALLIIAATRGRLSYQHYQRETALPAPVTDRGQEKGEVRTSV
jgi:CAAX protease family protein